VEKIFILVKFIFLLGVLVIGLKLIKALVNFRLKYYQDKLSKIKKSADPVNTCKICGADLSKEKSITREYKGDGDSVYGLGHYEDDGTYEPDVETSLGSGRYDLQDGSDTCSSCFEVVG